MVHSLNHPHVIVLILYLRVTHTHQNCWEEQERPCLVLCATFPMLVSRDHNFRSESVHQVKRPRWIGPFRPKLVAMGAPAKMCKFSTDHLEFRLLAGGISFALRLSGLTWLHSRHNGAKIDPVRVLGTQQKIQTRRRSHQSLPPETGWKLSSDVPRYC